VHRQIAIVRWSRWQLTREVAVIGNGSESSSKRKTNMSLSLLIIIVLVLLLIGALPTWGYSRSWGYRPMGGLGLILVIVIVLWLLGVFH